MTPEELDEMIARLEAERKLLAQAIDALKKYRGEHSDVPMPPQFSPDLLTAKQVAAMLNIDLMTVYNRAGKGKLPCIRHSRSLRFRKSDIEKLIDATKAPPD